MCFSPSPRAPPHPTAEARGDKAKWVFTWPLIFLLCITIPNCSKPRWEKYFMVTFITATLWIAVFSYLMVWLVSGGSRVVCAASPHPARAGGGRAGFKSDLRHCCATCSKSPTFTDVGLFLRERGFSRGVWGCVGTGDMRVDTAWHLPSGQEWGRRRGSETCSSGVMGRGPWQGDGDAL